MRRRFSPLSNNADFFKQHTGHSGLQQLYRFCERCSEFLLDAHSDNTQPEGAHGRVLDSIKMFNLQITRREDECASLTF